jgi:hypothetical protein
MMLFSIHDESKTMPAHFLRESGERTAFEQFSDSAQRIGVYTAADYIDIMYQWLNGKLIKLPV